MKFNAKDLRKTLLSATSILALASCGGEDCPSAIKTPSDFSAEITNITNNVIVHTYADLDAEAQKIVSASNALTIGDVEALKRVRDAWRKTRVPWERSEGFLYGPVDTKGIDPSIDSWPLDLTFLNNVLDGNDIITAKFLAAENNNAKGFHTIEYLLWGIDGDKAATDFTAKEIEYLGAAAEDLRNNTQALHDGWISNFDAQFLTLPSENYKSQKNVLQEIVDGISIIADEVANAKIEVPLNGAGGVAAPDQEESRFAHNSKADFVNNIISIQNIYLGDYSSVDDSSNGVGISDILIAEGNTDLDSKIKEQITGAISAIESIPGTFTEAIVNSRESVKKAQEKVSELFNTLDTNLKPAIDALN